MTQIVFFDIFFGCGIFSELAPDFKWEMLTTLYGDVLSELYPSSLRLGTAYSLAFRSFEQDGRVFGGSDAGAKGSPACFCSFSNCPMDAGGCPPFISMSSFGLYSV